MTWWGFGRGVRLFGETVEVERAEWLEDLRGAVR